MPPRDPTPSEFAARRCQPSQFHHIPQREKNQKAMSRRTATIVEEFDDDTDLPLPNRALPNTGTRGAILEEIGSDREVGEDSGDEDDYPDLMELDSTQPSATGSASRQEGSNSGDRSTVTDIKPYKS